MKNRYRLNGMQTLTLSFAALIFVGALLLMLPVASRSGGGVPFPDALFTAASASCVTGLVLFDTATQFTLFGQMVILCLIQIGGLSFVTISALTAVFLGRKIGLHRRVVLMDTVGALQMGGIVRLARRVLWVTLTCEGIGAVLLVFWFCPRYGGRGLWMAVFHAVSAFCNAGFDLLGTGASLTTEAAAPLLNLVLIFLILAGGLGFLVWDDILNHKLRFRRWRLHSKIVLTADVLLVCLGTAAFYWMEKDHAFAGVPLPQQLLMALFQSATPRTAGFNTVDLMQLQESSILLTMLLMVIGAGSGSTGGGIKMTTFVVVLLTAEASVRRKTDVDAFDRRLDDETVHRAFSIVCIYSLACVCGGMVLCLQGIPVEKAMFEAVSAISTVGLTRGVTPTLQPLSKIVIILLMFFGRVGSMSVVMAITSDKPQPKVRNVSEKILVG